MLEGDSLVKARYARTILRVARGTDRQTAARLIGGLVGDLPHADERPEVALLHITAIDAFAGLAKALSDPASADRQKPWDDAADAARAWLHAVGG
jgi:hypothetical protein